MRGHTEEALTWAVRAYEAGYRRVFTARQDPMFDSVRDDPRWTRLLDRMQADVDEMRRRVEAEERTAGER